MNSSTCQLKFLKLSKRCCHEPSLQMTSEQKVKNNFVPVPKIAQIMTSSTGSLMFWNWVKDIGINITLLTKEVKMACKTYFLRNALITK